MRVLSAGKGEVVALGFAPGRALLVAAYEREGVFVWDLATDAAAVSCGPPEYFRPRTIVFSPDGERFFRTAGRRYSFNIDTGQRTPVGPVASGSIFDSTQSQDGDRVLMLHGTWSAPKLSAWHRSGDSEAGWTEDWTTAAGQGATSGLVLSPTGDCAVHLRRQETVPWRYRYQMVVRNPLTGEQTGLGEYPYTYTSRFLFRPDGAQLVGIHEMTLLVWDMPAAGEPRLVRNDTRKHFTSAAFHPSGRYLFTTSNDTTVLVWDTTTWKHVTRFTWNIGRLRSVATSPDGTLAAVGSDKGRVMVWDVDL